jgi:hypothetical protein
MKQGGALKIFHRIVVDGMEECITAGLNKVSIRLTESLGYTLFGAKFSILTVNKVELTFV